MRHLVLTPAMRRKVLAMYRGMEEGGWTHEAVKEHMGFELGVSRMSAYLNVYGMRYDWKMKVWRRSVDRGQLGLIRHYERGRVKSGMPKGTS